MPELPEFVRVTDDVKPRREYTIPSASYLPSVHQLLEDKPALNNDGTPVATKYTPEGLSSEATVEVADGSDAAPDGGYAEMTIPQLKAEIDARNEGRDEGHLAKSGSKQDLIDALEADDAHESLSSSGQEATTPEGD